MGDNFGDDEQPPTGPMRNGSPSFGEFAGGILAVRGDSNGVGVLTSSTAGDLARGDREDGLRLRGGSATGPKNVKLASSTSTGAGLAVVLRGADALTDSTCSGSRLPAAGDGDRLRSTIGSGDAPRKDSRSLIESVSVCPSTFVGDRSATLSAWPRDDAGRYVLKTCVRLREVFWFSAPWRLRGDPRTRCSISANA